MNLLEQLRADGDGLDSLNLSARAGKKLSENGITRREQLEKLSREDLLALPR